MTIQHNIITDPDIHEPKGAATAASGKVYVANGSGSGTWETVDTANLTDGAVTPTKLNGLADNGTAGQLIQTDGDGTFTYLDATSYGSAYFPFSTSTTYDFSATTTDAIVNPTLTAGTLKNFTLLSSPNLRLRYDGTSDHAAFITVTFSTKQASGTNRDAEWALFKNGIEIAGSRAVRTLSSGYGSITLISDGTLSTNDYLEVKAKASGACTIQFASFSINVQGVVA